MANSQWITFVMALALVALQQSAAKDLKCYDCSGVEGESKVDCTVAGPEYLKPYKDNAASDPEHPPSNPFGPKITDALVLKEKKEGKLELYCFQTTATVNKKDLDHYGATYAPAEMDGVCLDDDTISKLPEGYARISICFCQNNACNGKRPEAVAAEDRESNTISYHNDGYKMIVLVLSMIVKYQLSKLCL